ncbi:MAG: YkgJ family cysteine cluster protein [Candidatus Woesearchaeota archaeon]
MIQRKDSFKCRNCGYCCMQIVLLSKKDIERIKEAGYDEREFVEEDALGRKRIRMKNYYCYFLGLHKGETFCRIYHVRPKICRDYPFLKEGTAECCPPIDFDLGAEKLYRAKSKKPKGAKAKNRKSIGKKSKETKSSKTKSSKKEAKARSDGNGNRARDKSP